MFVLEFRGKPSQYQAIDDAIRTVQFVRDKCLRYWQEKASCMSALTGGQAS